MFCPKCGTENPDTGRPQHLMTTEDHKICSPLLNIGRLVRNMLRGVHQYKTPFRMRDFNDLSNRNFHSENIRNRCDRNNPGLRGKLFSKVIQIKLAIGRNSSKSNERTRSFRQLLPGDNIGVMLKNRQQDLVTFLDAGISPGTGNEIDCGCRSGCARCGPSR